MPEATPELRLAAVAIAATGVLLSACEREPPPAPPPAAPPEAEAEAAPVVAPPPALDRAGLLRSMESAASDYTAGRPAEGETLAGRRFVLRQAFGCEDPAPGAGAAAEGVGRWSWATDRKTIQVSLAPGDWTDSPLIAGGADSWEAVEGFWLARPWLRSEGCPGVAADPLASGPGEPSPQTMGVAAVYETDSSRLGRRNGRAYSFAVRGDDDRPPSPAGGYRLVLEGRLTAFNDGRAIRCHTSRPDQRPVCIAAALVDRVAFEDAGGRLLKEWRAG